MTNFRVVCTNTGCKPRNWNGAGELAAAIFENNKVPKRPLSKWDIKSREGRGETGKPWIDKAVRRPERPEEFEIAASAAYFGGRAEVSRIGYVPGPIYQYDLNSAYPSAMLDLPCPMHTTWEHRPQSNRLPRGLYLAKVRFAHPPGNRWCGLPIRTKDAICWPYMGIGWYWSVEIESAQKYLGTKIINVLDLWVARQTRCECRTFEFIRGLYQKRLDLEAEEKSKGHPIKTGLNAMYGKEAQQYVEAPPITMRRAPA